MTLVRPAELRKHWKSPGACVFLVVLLVYAVYELRLERVRPLWFDEMATLFTATQPTLRQMFQSELPDPNPPLTYLLSRGSMALFGTSSLALRLPEFAALLVTIICAYIFVRRRFGAGAGALAASLVAGSPLGFYAIEARSYGLVAAFTSLTLVFWQRATMLEGRRRGALLGLGISVFALTVTHTFALVYIGLPLFVSEAVRFYRTRRFDRGVFFSVLLGFSGLAITFPLALAARAVLLRQAGHWTAAIASPNPWNFKWAVRLVMLSIPVKLVAPMALAIGLGARRQPHSPHDSDLQDDGGIQTPAHEWAVAVVLSCMVPVMWVFTHMVTHYFFERYTFPACIGIALLLAMMCGRTPGRRFVLPGLAVSLLILFVSDTRKVITDLAQSHDPARSALLSHAVPDTPIVVASSVAFPSIWWYSSPAMRQRLHFVQDTPHALRTPDFIPELYLSAEDERHTLPFRLDRRGEFLRANPNFTLLYTEHAYAGGEWLPEDLHQQNYAFQILAEDNGLKLARVTAPASTPKQ